MITLFYALIYEEFNYYTKKWEKKRDLYNSIDSAILMKNLLNDSKYCFKKIEEVVMITYRTGFVEFVQSTKQEDLC